MHPVTIEIYGPNFWHHINEICALVGTTKLYAKGTDESRYVDFRDRESADLMLIQLRLMEPEVHAKILGE